MTGVTPSRVYRRLLFRRAIFVICFDFAAVQYLPCQYHCPALRCCHLWVSIIVLRAMFFLWLHLCCFALQNAQVWFHICLTCLMLFHELLIARIALMRAGQSWGWWSLALNIGISVVEEDFDGVGPSFPGRVTSRVWISWYCLLQKPRFLRDSMVFLVSLEPLRTLHSLADWERSSQAFKGTGKLDRLDQSCARLGKTVGKLAC